MGYMKHKKPNFYYKRDSSLDPLFINDKSKNCMIFIGRIDCPMGHPVSEQDAMTICKFMNTVDEQEIYEYEGLALRNKRGDI